MNGKRVLVIDDDQELCDGMAFILTDEGYQVKNTSSPVNGKELIDKYTFDIAIIDYKMPNISGAELTKRIKGKNPETAVFIVSGWPSVERFLEEDNVTNLIAGILGKPFAEKDLLDMLAQVK